MANSFVQPYKGILNPDISHLDGIVVDLGHGTMRGLRRQKAGILKVLGEIQQGIPVHAVTLGVAPDIHDRISALTDKIEKVREARVIIDKLAEVLEETEAYLEDEREGEIGLVVNAVRGAGRRKDPSVLTSFEETRRYHGQISARAYKTRRKNAEQAEADAEAETETPPAEAPVEHRKDSPAAVLTQ
jgi:hypothetical protein